MTFVAGVSLTNVYTGVNAYIDAMTTEIPTVKVDELRIKLPVVNSNSPLVVRPQSDRFPHLVGAGGAGGCVKTYGSTRYHCPPFLNITSKPRSHCRLAAPSDRRLPAGLFSCSLVTNEADKYSAVEDGVISVAHIARCGTRPK